MYDAQVLLFTAASIGFLHTILGPDHYVVFSVMGKARGWTLAKTLRVTMICGAGHVLSSLLLGAVGLLLGARLASLQAFEGLRGGLAGWALLAFGLMYFAWGLREAGRGRRHSHIHVHEDVVHDHEHDHRSEHSHVHDNKRDAITPWAIFIIFVLGPCEALIPLLMYPAAQQSAALVLWVALVFGLVTVATMMAAVAITTLGLDKLKLPSSGRWAHAAAGASIAACGIAITFLGL
ncbi:MAG: sulfite exporter TauE/SafE family protein [Gammaproteobacteria bacterium]|nr:sulfite exporter TauE/SafE family protein [Gammaproteobacteria bacterium]